MEFMHFRKIKKKFCTRHIEPSVKINSQIFNFFIIALFLIYKFRNAQRIFSHLENGGTKSYNTIFSSDIVKRNSTLGMDPEINFIEKQKN